MEITELVIRVLLLFFPGIICFYLVEALTTHRERKPHEVFILTFVLGALCYLAYGIVYYIVGTIRYSSYDVFGFAYVPPDNLSIFSVLADNKAKLNFWEIAWVSLVSVFVGLAISTAINRKWLNDFAQYVGISKKFGDLNVWSYVLNADNVEWATIRDMDRNLMFMGRIQAFSDLDDIAEIVLSNVVVYDEKLGNELYKAERMYLSRKRENLIIELPYTPETPG